MASSRAARFGTRLDDSGDPTADQVAEAAAGTAVAGATDPPLASPDAIREQQLALRDAIEDMERCGDRPPIITVEEREPVISLMSNRLWSSGSEPPREGLVAAAAAGGGVLAAVTANGHVRIGAEDELTQDAIDVELPTRGFDPRGKPVSFISVDPTGVHILVCFADPAATERAAADAAVGKAVDPDAKLFASYYIRVLPSGQTVRDLQFIPGTHKVTAVAWDPCGSSSDSSGHALVGVCCYGKTQASPSGQAAEARRSSRLGHVGGALYRLNINNGSGAAKQSAGKRERVGSLLPVVGLAGCLLHQGPDGNNLYAVMIAVDRPDQTATKFLAGGPTMPDIIRAHEDQTDVPWSVPEAVSGRSATHCPPAQIHLFRRSRPLFAVAAHSGLWDVRPQADGGLAALHGPDAPDSVALLTRSGVTTARIKPETLVSTVSTRARELRKPMAGRSAAGSAGAAAGAGGGGGGGGRGSPAAVCVNIYGLLRDIQTYPFPPPNAIFLPGGAREHEIHEADLAQQRAVLQPMVDEELRADELDAEGGHAGQTQHLEGEDHRAMSAPGSQTGVSVGYAAMASGSRTSRISLLGGGGPAGAPGVSSREALGVSLPALDPTTPFAGLQIRQASARSQGGAAGGAGASSAAAARASAAQELRLRATQAGAELCEQAPSLPIAMCVTEAHFLLLFWDRLVALSVLDGSVSASVPAPQPLGFWTNLFVDPGPQCVYVQQIPTSRLPCLSPAAISDKMQSVVVGAVCPMGFASATLQAFASSNQQRRQHFPGALAGLANAVVVHSLGGTDAFALSFDREKDRLWRQYARAAVTPIVLATDPTSQPQPSLARLCPVGKPGTWWLESMVTGRMRPLSSQEVSASNRHFDDALVSLDSEGEGAEARAILRVRAHVLWMRGEYHEAAECLAGTPAAVEDVALRLMEVGEVGALVTFLRLKLDALRSLGGRGDAAAGAGGAAGDGGDEDYTVQCTLLATWLVELLLAQMHAQRVTARRAGTGSEAAVQAARRESELEQTLRDLITEHKPVLDKETILQLLSSHGRDDLLLFICKVWSDHQRIVAHLMLTDQFSRAISNIVSLLVRSASAISGITARRSVHRHPAHSAAELEQARSGLHDACELMYKHAPILVKKRPRRVFSAWMGCRKHLDVSRLLPALVDYTAMRRHFHTIAETVRCNPEVWAREWLAMRSEAAAAKHTTANGFEMRGGGDLDRPSSPGQAGEEDLPLDQDETGAFLDFGGDVYPMADESSDDDSMFGESMVGRSDRSGRPHAGEAAAGGQLAGAGLDEADARARALLEPAPASTGEDARRSLWAECTAPDRHSVVQRLAKREGLPEHIGSATDLSVLFLKQVINDAVAPAMGAAFMADHAGGLDGLEQPRLPAAVYDYFLQALAIQFAVERRAAGLEPVGAVNLGLHGSPAMDVAVASQDAAFAAACGAGGPAPALQPAFESAEAQEAHAAALARLPAGREMEDFLRGQIRAAQSDGRTPPLFDPAAALRLCREYAITRPQVLLYEALGMWTEACRLALSDSVALSKQVARTLSSMQPDRCVPITDVADDRAPGLTKAEHGELVRELWLIIVQRVVETTQSATAAIHVVKQANGVEPIEAPPGAASDADAGAATAGDKAEVLRIDDVLPLFPDTTVIDTFKTEVSNSVSNCEKEVKRLEGEMRGMVGDVQNYHGQIEQLRSRMAVVHGGQTCKLCGQQLIQERRDFYVFQSGFGYHSACLIGAVQANLSVREQDFLDSLIARIQRLRAAIAGRPDPLGEAASTATDGAAGGGGSGGGGALPFGGAFSVRRPGGSDREVGLRGGAGEQEEAEAEGKEEERRGGLQLVDVSAPIPDLPAARLELGKLQRQLDEMIAQDDYLLSDMVVNKVNEPLEAAPMPGETAASLLQRRRRERRASGRGPWDIL